MNKLGSLAMSVPSVCKMYQNGKKRRATNTELQEPQLKKIQGFKSNQKHTSSYQISLTSQLSYESNPTESTPLFLDDHGSP